MDGRRDGTRKDRSRPGGHYGNFAGAGGESESGYSDDGFAGSEISGGIFGRFFRRGHL